MRQAATLPVTGTRPSTNADAATKDRHGRDLNMSVAAGKASAASLTPVSATSASDRNAARARAERWSTRGAGSAQHTPAQ